MRNVLIDIVGRDMASNAFLKSAAAAETATGRMLRAGQKATKAGALLSRSVTLPVAAAVAVSVDQAAKFQKSNTLLETAGGELQRNMGRVSKGLKSIAVDTGTSLDQLGTGAYTVEKAGLRGANMLKVLKAASQGAKAENVDLGTSTNALTSVMMSYHLGASKAVQTENMLIRGSGLAKVSMQDYAGSLSTVIPIASAAGISFAQIAGAEATLTQHGTSADEATQELAFTIRNLQRPNALAAKAMQQLHINVTDLEQNLGKRGLTGTLSLIEGKLSHYSKAGMVVVDTFKRSQSATANLTTELSAMPPQLQAISKQFDTGKLGYKDYLTQVKDLGGQQYQLGKGFIATEAQAKGFNTLLTSGLPAQRTAAAALRDVMGGATGLNTALQLGGENSKYFNRATKLVAAAAHETSGDVLGWAKTQDLLSVKVDKAKESLQVTAVELGTELIPAVTKVVGWVEDGVTAFDGLSSSNKKLIGYTALTVAALGPVLSIGGRLLTMFGAVRVGLAKVGIGSVAESRTVGSSQASQTRSVVAAVEAQTVAMRELIAMQRAVAENALASSSAVSRSSLVSVRAYQRQALVAGESAAASRVAATSSVAAVGGGAVAGGGLARGRMRLGGTGTMVAGLGAYFGGKYLGGAISGDSAAGSGRNMAGSAIQYAGAGAAVGSLFGPEGLVAGAAVGAGVGVLKSYIGGLDKLSAGEKTFTAIDQKSARTVQGFSRALLVGGKSLKANQTSIAQASLAHTGLIAQAGKAGLTTKDLTNAITGNAAAYNKVVAAWTRGSSPSQSVLLSLAKERDNFQQGRVAAGRFADAHGRVVASEVKTVGQTALLSGRLGNLNSMHLTAAANATIFDQRLKDVTRSVALNGKTLDGDTSFGQKNISVIKAAAAQSLAHAQAVYQQTGSLKKADTALASDRTQLIQTATQAGLTAGQAKGLADQILGIPANRKSKITVDVASARRELTSFGSFYDTYIATLSSKSIHPHVNIPELGNTGVGLLTVPGGVPTGGGAGSHTGDSHARGGTIPGTGNRDTHAAMLTPGEEVTPKRQAIKYRPLLKAIARDDVPGYAKGGTIGGNIAETQSWLRNRVNPLPYVFGATGPGAYDCSGLVGATISHLMGKDSHARLFSTSNEGSVLPGLGFKRGAGTNAAMVVGWEHDGHLEHTTASVGGLKLEAYGNNGVALRDQIRIGSNARDPRTFPNVMHLPGGKGATPGGDPSSSGGGGGSRAGKLASAASSRVGTLIGNVGQAGGGSSSPIDLSQVSIGRVQAQIAAAQKALGDTHISARARTRFGKEIADLTKLANKQLGGLRVKIRTKDLADLRKGLTGTVSDTRTALDGLVSDMRHAGASAKAIATTRAAGGQLVTGQGRLLGMKSYRSTIAGTLSGAYDPTTAGSVTDLVTGMRSATSTNLKYAGELSKLHAEARGNKTLTAFINKLAASGQTTTLDTLAHSSRGGLLNVTKSLDGLNASVGTGADAAVAAKYDESIGHQTAQVAAVAKHVDHLADQVAEVAHHVGRVATAVAQSNRRPIHVDGTPLERKGDKKLDHILRQLEADLRHGRL